MQRNDLTTEEVRVERLLRTLGRDPAAPDPEFLRVLREASTQAFLAAQAHRPQSRRVQLQTPSDSASGRRVLRSLRILMLSAVAVLLVLGALPPSVFPSRGVELQVAFDNLSRNETVEIEVQNGRVSKTLLYASSLGDERLAFTYPSGNWEVIHGGSAAFVNPGNNSIHPSPLDVAEVSLNLLEDKLMSSMNVNDPQVKSLLLSQRPKSQREENGQLLNYYHFQSPAALSDGETLNVDATVNATTNSLVAMNSRVIDSTGKVQFEANADVKGLNTAIPLDRFQVDLHAEALDQIAMVEDVQGNAEVLEGTAQQFGVGVYDNGDRSYSNLSNVAVQRNDANGHSNAPGFGRTRSFAGGLGGGMAGGGLGGGLLAPQQQTDGSALQHRFEVAQSEDLSKKLEGNESKGRSDLAFDAKSGREKNSQPQQLAPKGPDMAKKESGAPAAREVDGEVAAEKPSPKIVLQDPQRRSKVAEPKSPALPSDEPAPAKKANAAGFSKSVNVAENAPPAPPKPSETKPSEMKPKAAKSNPDSKELASDAVKSGAPAPITAAAQSPAAAAPAPREAEELQVKQQMKSGSGARYANPPLSRSQKSGIATSDIASPANAPSAEVEVRVNPSEKNSRFMDDVANLKLPLGQGVDRPVALSSQQIGLRGAEYSEQLGQFSGNAGYGSRLVEARSELRPGETLRTGDDPTNIVRARLANNANLIVGPGSEVLLLKPTEVRLRFGELALEVPEGDQVDLLGPEPELQQEAENYKFNYRRSGYQQRVTRLRQVTGNKAYTVQKNQLQELDQQPEWLTKYYARYNTKSESQKAYPMRAKTSTMNNLNQSGTLDKAAAPPPATEAPQKKN